MVSLISHSLHQKYPAHVCNLVIMAVGVPPLPDRNYCEIWKYRHAHTPVLSAHHSKRCFLILVVFDPILKHIPAQMKAICRTFSIQMGCQEEGLRIVSAESAIKPMLSSSAHG